MFEDPLARAAHVRRVGIVAGQLEREVGLDRGADVAGPAGVLGPETLLALLGAEVAGDAVPLLAIADPEVVGEQQVLGGDRGVGFELAPPEAGWVLVGQQPVLREA